MYCIAVTNIYQSMHLPPVHTAVGHVSV